MANGLRCRMARYRRGSGIPRLAEAAGAKRTYSREMARPHPVPAASIRDFRGYVSGSEQRVAPKGTTINHGGVLPIHKHVEFFAWLMQAAA